MVPYTAGEHTSKGTKHHISADGRSPQTSRTLSISARADEQHITAGEKDITADEQHITADEKDIKHHR